MKTVATRPSVRWSLMLAVLVAVLGPITTARAQGLNLVYTESNIGNPSLPPNSNSIYAYSNTGGVLTPLSGSLIGGPQPYLTGGTGVYDPGNVHTEFDADQEVVIVNNAYLLAVNGHTNTIASFTINSDGSLTPVSGSPFALPTGSQDPVGIGLVYNGLTIAGVTYSWVGVVDKNEDQNQNISGTVPNTTTFKLNSHGKLSTIPNSTIAQPANSSPAQFLTPTRHQAYLDILQGSTPGIVAYNITTGGSNKLINSAGPPVTGALVLGMAANPKFRYIYVGLPSLSEVGVYTYEASTGTMPGAISFVREVANTGKAVCWSAVNSAGTYLYTAESNSGTITVYSLAHAAFPVQVQHFTLTTTAGVTTPAPANEAFDPTGAYLYVLDNANSVLHVLSVDSATGLVSEPNAPTVLGSPAGEEALGLATLCIPTSCL